ncbi:hypothetical protein HC761_00195 [bacterium]|nr:hypothetical protein [bacterium]
MTISTPRPRPSHTRHPTLTERHFLAPCQQIRNQHAAQVFRTTSPLLLKPAQFGIAIIARARHCKLAQAVMQHAAIAAPMINLG